MIRTLAFAGNVFYVKIVYVENDIVSYLRVCGFFSLFGEFVVSNALTQWKNRFVIRRNFPITESSKRWQTSIYGLD